MSANGVLAIFVKTPEISPVKTRLAAGIGQANALLFYLQSIKATAALALKAKSELTNLEVIWAVAEEEGLGSDRWKQFTTFSQGDGALGERLHRVYTHLLNRYDYVAFMGADSPHISSAAIANALRLTEKSRHQSFIIGETYDGGFYFFGGGKKLPRDVWLSVEYSTELTARQLKAQLQKFGGLEEIETNFDIDTIEDLHQLAKCKKTPLAEQNTIIEWARTLK